MPTMTKSSTAPAGGASNPSGSAPSMRPFSQGSWEYSEPMFTDTATPGANAQAFTHNITPGGYLRGVTLSVTGAGGVVGTAVFGADSPWSLLIGVSIESIDGTALYYPLGGYAAYLVDGLCRPWDRDPQLDPKFSNSINPSFRLRVFLESRATLGVVPNTDARAQYRVLYSIAPLANWITGGAASTVPTLTINGYLETWAQPPASDLNGTSFVQAPPGLCLQRFVSHSVPPTQGGDFPVQSVRVGNLIRNVILVFRDNSGAQGGAGNRVDLTGDPIRVRLDNTSILTEFRDRRDWYHDQFYGAGRAMATRPVGVYAYPRFHLPGDIIGQSWMETTEASYFQFELQGAPAGGTCEIITEDLVPIDDVPNWMMGI